MVDFGVFEPAFLGFAVGVFFDILVVAVFVALFTADFSDFLGVVLGFEVLTGIIFSAFGGLASDLTVLEATSSARATTICFCVG